jgi:hypothetical protein
MERCGIVVVVSWMKSLCSTGAGHGLFLSNPESGLELQLFPMSLINLGSKRIQVLFMLIFFFFPFCEKQKEADKKYLVRKQQFLTLCHLLKCNSRHR